MILVYGAWARICSGFSFQILNESHGHHSSSGVYLTLSILAADSSCVNRTLRRGSGGMATCGLRCYNPLKYGLIPVGDIDGTLGSGTGAVAGGALQRPNHKNDNQHSLRKLSRGSLFTVVDAH